VLSRAERGRLTAEAEPIQLARLLERIVQREATVLPTIDITLAQEPRLPIVAGEETYVEQVVRNLLGNAAKYCPPGTRVIVEVARAGEAFVGVTVRDEGPGISEEAASRVFELFYRDPERAKTVSGSGIGLFVCAALVESMGGRIWATRGTERGSAFSFTLPIHESDEVVAEPATGMRRLTGVTGAPGPLSESEVAE
jgi:signal transduction histidine kinase